MNLINIRSVQGEYNYEKKYLASMLSHNHGLYLAPFEHSKVIEQKEWPHHYFYEVEKSTLIEQLVKNSDGLVSAERLRHFVVRVYEGLFDIVTRNTDVRIVEIKREF